MNKGHLCWTQGNHTWVNMFIIIWFTSTQVKKDALGWKENDNYSSLKKSFSGFQKKELDSLLRFKALLLCWTNRAAQFEVEKRDSVAAALWRVK